MEKPAVQEEKPQGIQRLNNLVTALQHIVEQIKDEVELISLYTGINTKELSMYVSDREFKEGHLPVESVFFNFYGSPADWVVSCKINGVTLFSYIDQKAIIRMTLPKDVEIRPETALYLDFLRKEAE